MLSGALLTSAIQLSNIVIDSFSTGPGFNGAVGSTNASGATGHV